MRAGRPVERCDADGNRNCCPQNPYRSSYTVSDRLTVVAFGRQPSERLTGVSFRCSRVFLHPGWVEANSYPRGWMLITGRDRHLHVLEYIAQKYGDGKAFSNFIIGIEDISTLKEGATWLTERGILPSASVWMPFGRPVQGSMKAPDIDYYRRVKELFAKLYTKHKLEPTPSRGLNVCIERDIWKYAVFRISSEFEYVI